MYIIYFRVTTSCARCFPRTCVPHHVHLRDDSRHPTDRCLLITGCRRRLPAPSRIRPDFYFLRSIQRPALQAAIQGVGAKLIARMQHVGIAAAYLVTLQSGLRPANTGCTHSIASGENALELRHRSLRLTNWKVAFPFLKKRFGEQFKTGRGLEERKTVSLLQT